MPLNVNTFYACSLDVHLLKEGGRRDGEREGRMEGGGERREGKEREKSFFTKIIVLK